MSSLPPTNSDNWIDRRFNRDKNLRHDAFDILDEFTAYWIGFILADGNIENNLSKSVARISFQLGQKDENHLRKLKAFIKSSNSIQQINRQNSLQAGFRFTSRTIIDKLNYYGIQPCKSLVVEVHPELQFNRHFWRGVIDGDGCIGDYKYTELSILGTQNVVQSFLNFGSQIVPNTIQVYKKGNIFGAKYTGMAAKKLIYHIYSNSNIFLDRKFELAQKVALNVKLTT